MKDQKIKIMEEKEIAQKLNDLFIQICDIQHDISTWSDKLDEVEAVDRENYKRYIQKSEEEILVLKSKIDEIQNEVKSNGLDKYQSQLDFIKSFINNVKLKDSIQASSQIYLERKEMHHKHIEITIEIDNLTRKIDNLLKSDNLEDVERLKTRLVELENQRLVLEPMLVMVEEAFQKKKDSEGHKLEFMKEFLKF